MKHATPHRRQLTKKAKPQSNSKDGDARKAGEKATDGCWVYEPAKLQHGEVRRCKIAKHGKINRDGSSAGEASVGSSAVVVEMSDAFVAEIVNNEKE